MRIFYQVRGVLRDEQRRAQAAGPRGGGPAALALALVTSRDGTRGDMSGNRLWTVRPVDLTAGTALLAAPGPVRAGSAFTDTWRAAQVNPLTATT